jgi:5-methylcytosine-specific restriction endonuclease McrA
VKDVKRLPSIEEFADKTGHSLRRVVKGALLRLAPEFRTAKVRRELLLKQNNLCSCCGNALVDSGRETHVDHKWTTDEAANAVFDGSMDLISAYNKLWAPENLQATHAKCNFGRNKKLRKVHTSEAKRLRAATTPGQNPT